LTLSPGLSPTNPASDAPAPAVDGGGSGGTAAAVAGAVLLTLVPFVLDVVLAWTNLAILYVLPLFVAARAGRPRVIAVFAAVLVGLTYGGYLLEVLYLSPAPPFTFRIVNRTIVATAVVVSALLLRWWMRWREQAGTRVGPVRHGDQDQAVYDEVIAIVERLLAGMACAAYVAAVAAGDLLAPGEYNLPILYAIPVLLAGLTHSRAFLWATAAVLLLLVPAGYKFGPPPNLPESVLTFVLTNRALAAFAIVVLTLSVHVWMRRIK